MRIKVKIALFFAHNWLKDYINVLVLLHEFHLSQGRKMKEMYICYLHVFVQSIENYCSRLSSQEKILV